VIRVTTGRQTHQTDSQTEHIETHTQAERERERHTQSQRDRKREEGACVWEEERERASDRQ